MSELKFTRVNNEEYKTISFFVENAFVTITEDDYKLINTEKTKFGYKKATLRLINSELIDKLKSWETQINDYLKSEGVGPITILYAGWIYPKASCLLSDEKKHHIMVKSIWVNENNKPFTQLWYVCHS